MSDRIKCKICNSPIVDYVDMGAGEFWGWCETHEDEVDTLIYDEEGAREQAHEERESLMAAQEDWDIPKMRGE